MVSAPERNKIGEYFEQEYKDYINEEALETIGFINIDERITIPIEASVLINHQLFIYSNTFYYKHGGYTLSIVLKDNEYEIITDKRFDSSVIFYIHEILMRLYASNFEIVFLHASAFYYKNNTYVINAFGGTGKTNLILDAIFANGKYLADDLAAIDKEGNIYPYTKRINLLYYNFNYAKELMTIFNKKRLVDLAIKNIEQVKKNNILYIHFLSKIEWRLKKYLSVKVRYEQIYNTSYDKKYKATKFIWLERSRERSELFYADKAYVYSRMKFCLDIENRSYLDFYGFLNLSFSDIARLRNQQNEIVRSIVDSNEFLGFKKHDKDEGRLFKLITETI